MDVYDWNGAPVRDLSASNAFADITTAPYLGSERVEVIETVEGEEAYLYPWVYHFNGDLTTAQVAAVLYRARSTAEQEADRKLLDGLVSQIDALQRGSGTLAPADLSNAVRLLARALGALERETKRGR